MILAVLSHGRDGQVVTSDGLPVDTEDIYARFNNTNCPLLQGKPKFFIVQACRGDETDVSFPDRNEMFADLGPNRKRNRTRGDYDTVPIPTYGELNTARPNWEDMIIAYSTIPGTNLKDFQECLQFRFFKNVLRNDLENFVTEFWIKNTYFLRNIVDLGVQIRNGGTYLQIFFSPYF